MKISVVIAAYNEEKLIGRCLKAILMQEYLREDFEIIVIDNNSTDNTRKIAKELGITPLVYKDQQGAVWAKNYGAQQARGNIVAITDADSVPRSDWLQNIELLMKNEKIKCVGGIVVSMDGKRLSFALLKIFSYIATVLQPLGIPLIWGSNMAFKNEVFKKVGGFNTQLNMCDDAEFVLRVQKKYGLRSVVYSKKLFVRVSPRKLEKINDFTPYFFGGLASLIAIFIFRKSMSFGTNTAVR